MAIQGKGILGGFKGKVGSVVGYIRNKQQIVQTIGNRSKNNGNLIYDKFFYSPTANNDVTVGDYFVINDSYAPQNNHYAYINRSFDGNLGYLSWWDSKKSSQYQVGISEVGSQLNTVLADIRILINGSGWGVLEHNSYVKNISSVAQGVRYELLVFTKKYRINLYNSLGELIEYFENDRYALGPFQVVFAMRSNGAIVSEVMIGSNRFGASPF